MPKLIQLKHTTMRFQTEAPSLSSIPITPYEWEDSVCDNVTELLPQDAPTPKRKYDVTISYHDANLCYNIAIGRSVTVALCFLKKAPIDSHSKKQSAVEISACRSE